MNSPNSLTERTLEPSESTKAQKESVSAVGAVLRKAPATPPFAISQPLSVEEVTLDPPIGFEVLVRIEAAGLCHSDLSVVDGTRPRPLPMLLGHEACGIVEQLGENVNNVAIGDRVVLTFLPRCGSCEACSTDGKLPCILGSKSNATGELISGGQKIRQGTEVIAHHLGVSGFSTHAVVDVRSIVPVGKDIPPPIAALMGCAVLTGGGALLNEGKIDSNSKVGIVGLGGVGMAALLTACAVGCKEIVAIDPNPEKIAMATEFGSTQAMSPTEADEANLELDVVLEAVGSPKALETAYRSLGLGGRLITVGLPAAEATASIRPLALTAKAQSIIGSYLGSAVPNRDIPRFESLYRQGKLPLEKLISREITLNDINEAMDSLASGQEIRQVIRFTH